MEQRTVPSSGSSSGAGAQADASASADRQAFLNALDTEFIYYAAALRDMSPRLVNEDQRASLEQWLRRLFSPEYCSEALKDHRNRLVCRVACWLGAALAGDEATVLPQPPDRGPLGSVPGPATYHSYSPAAWEVDNQWLHFLRGVPSRVRAKCGEHDGSCPPCDADHDWELDQELKLLLHLAAPLRPRLGSSTERRLCGQWLRYLCSATPEDCAALRLRRNLYARVLLGYLHGGELLGPFCAEPPWGDALPALGGPEGGSEGGGGDGWWGEDGTGDFLSMQPVPEEGAFCYVVVDGVVPVDLQC